MLAFYNLVLEKLDQDPWKRKKQLKSKQKYKSFMQFYADSVEGKKNAKLIIANKKSTTVATNDMKNAKDYQVKVPKKGKQKVSFLICFAVDDFTRT